jgi:bacterioferritin-associated ferredoxin
MKAQCTTGPERRISRWEHEAVLEKVQKRLDQNPAAMGVRSQTAEHPFGTIKFWMGATHFLTKKLPKVATEMALNVLAYNMKRVMAIAGVGGCCTRCRPEARSDAAKSAPTRRCPRGAKRSIFTELQDHRAQNVPSQPDCGLVE